MLLPGVSMKYLLWSTLKQRDAPDLYAPGKEAYEMLKEAVVGGSSVVFFRNNEAGKTRIRTHKFQDAKMCRKVLGYDSNALYPRTMLGDMPCGKVAVMHWPKTPGNVETFCRFLQHDKWFGLAEVGIEAPKELWENFEEMLPSFYNKPVSRAAVPQHMKDYLARCKRKPMHDQQKLFGALSALRILLYAPLLKWYLDHGLKVTTVHRTIDYVSQKAFKWFVKKGTENRRKGHKNPSSNLTKNC